MKKQSVAIDQAGIRSYVQAEVDAYYSKNLAPALINEWAIKDLFSQLFPEFNDRKMQCSQDAFKHFKNYLADKGQITMMLI